MIDVATDFSWRPIRPADIADWAGLLAAIWAADGDEEIVGEQDLLEEFSDPCRDFESASVAVYDGLTMAGYAALTAQGFAAAAHDMRLEGGVHPAYRGRGLGARLLQWAASAAVPLHQERHLGLPLTLTGRCLSRNDRALALFAAHGYRPARWFHLMGRDLTTALPQAAVPAGVEIACFTPERSEHARLVRNDAFRDHWGSGELTGDEWEQFTGYGVFRPAFSFLAYAGQEPVGIIMSHEYDAYTEATGILDVYVALVATRRSARRRGIASALLARVLTEAALAGFAAASLSVDSDSPTGAIGVYERAGFAVRDTYVLHRKALLSGAPPGTLGPGRPA